MSATKNLEVMRSILIPMADGDTRPFVQALHDDIVWTVSGVGPWAGSYRGKQVLREQLFGEVMPRLKQPYRLATKQLIADGDAVAVVLHGIGNQTLAGDPYPQQYCWICRLEGDKLKEVTEFADSDLALRVVGPPARSQR